MVRCSDLGARQRLDPRRSLEYECLMRTCHWTTVLAAVATLLLATLAPARSEPAGGRPAAPLEPAPVLVANNPLLIRIFKEESEFEVWMRRGERFELIATYPICAWSGTLGPKEYEGDRQTPEG